MPTILCAKKVACSCENTPISNYSTEDPDVQRYLSRSFFAQRPKYGTTPSTGDGIDGTTGPGSFIAAGCLALCYSTVSQQAADDCAAAQAKDCVWEDWTDPDGLPYVRFYNSNQYCLSYCPDGSPFYSSIPAGTVIALSQIEADRLAYALACRRAIANRICISQSDRDGCVGSFFECTLVAVGATLPAAWYLNTSLPGGLLFYTTGVSNVVRIAGTPTTAGNQSFSITVIDSNGDYITKTITVRFLQITTDAILAPGIVGTPYSESLAATGGSGSYVWSIESGTLPDGLTLSSAGVISGTPTSETTLDVVIKVCDSNF